MFLGDGCGDGESYVTYLYFDNNVYYRCSIIITIINEKGLMQWLSVKGKSVHLLAGMCDHPKE